MKRLECLDGLRGVLAMYVMVGHMAPFAALPGWLQKPLSHGGAAVDVFFMLSGLVILRSLESHGFAVRPFLIARAARTFPVYLAMLGLGIAVQAMPVPFAAMPWIGPASPAHGMWADGWPPDWPARIAAHLTMTHGLFPSGILPDVWVSFLGAAWSLSTEWQFYLLALLLCRTRMGPGALAAVFLGLAAAGLAWDALAPEAWRFSRAFLPNKAHYFALGLASASWISGRPDRRFVLVLAAVLGLCLAAGGAAGGVEKLLPPLVWTACLAAQVGGLRAGAPLRWRVTQWLGAISYPIYLANEPLQKLIGHGLARAAAGDAALFTLLWIPAAIGVPLAASWWLHRYLEVPVLAWGRSLRGSG